MSVVLVCGSHTFGNPVETWSALDMLVQTWRIERLVHGGAAFVDTFAGEWAAARGVPCISYAAAWRALGKRAGKVRNISMLLSERPDLVVAMPGGPGTAHMCAAADRAGVPVWRPYDK